MHPTPTAGISLAEPTARRYIAPVDSFTGCRANLPSTGATRSAWYFDANFVYQDESGPLDAPDYIPRGGVRALDLPKLTLGIADLPRPA